jgi:hypothetical protein
MSLEVSHIEVEDRHAGTGTLFRGGRAVPVASFTMSRAKYVARAPWRFAASIANDQLKEIRPIVMGESGRLTFDGHTEGGAQVHIPRIDSWRLRGGAFTAEVHELMRDFPAQTDTPDGIFIAVRLTPTKLAVTELDDLSMVPHSDGRIRPFDGGSVTEVATPVVEIAGLPFRFSLRFGFDNVQVAGRDSLLRVPMPSLTCAVPPERCRGDLRVFAREIIDGTEDVLRVLSLLDRHYIRWTRLEIESSSDTADRPLISSVWEKTAAIDDPDGSWGALANAYRLPTDALGHMVESFRALPEKRAVASAIVYLTAVLDAPHLETRFTSAFTALEALVQALSEQDRSDLTIRGSSAKRLATSLRAEIRRFSAGNVVGESAIEEMMEKVAEIQRRPIVPRVAEVVTRLGVVWRDIWPYAVDLSSPLSACYGRRNRFIHRGEFPPARNAFVDSQRLHALCERMLFRLLGGDTAWLTGHEYRYLADLARMERAKEPDESSESE